MLRIVSFVVAVTAIMAIPLSQADARHGGMSGGRSFSGGMRMGSMHMGSMRSGPRFNTVRSANFIGNRRIFVGNRRFHRGRFFVGGYGFYGYDSCWRWVPSVYGYRRVWVCDPYGYY
jgi:hypothetical protein